MSQNNSDFWIVVIIVGIIGVMALANYTNLFSTVVFEDYATYDARTVKPINTPSTWSQVGTMFSYKDQYWSASYDTAHRSGSSPNSVLFSDSNGYISIASACAEFEGSQVDCPVVELNTTKSLSGNDIKATVTCYGSRTYPNGGGSCKSGGASLSISGNAFVIKNAQSVNSGCGSATTLSNPVSTTIDVYSSKLNSSVADVYVNGVFSKTIYQNSNKLSFRQEGDISCTIDFIGYKVPFGCTQSSDEVLAQQTFIGPRQLSIYDLKYAPRRFCLEHPAIVTSNLNNGSTSTAEVYQRLSRGEVLTIPEGQTWTVYSIIYNDGSINGLECKDKAYDADKGACVGLVTFCGAGQTYDSAKGSCVAVSTEEVQTRDCGPFTRYDVQENACVIDFTQQAVCEKGDYNTVTKKCEYPYPGSCIARYERNGNVCEAVPLALIACDLGYSFNPTSGYCEQGNTQKPVIANTSDICDELDGTTKIVDGSEVCTFTANNTIIQNVTETKYITKEVKQSVWWLYGLVIVLVIALGVIASKKK